MQLSVIRAGIEPVGEDLFAFTGQDERAFVAAVDADHSDYVAWYPERPDRWRRWLGLERVLNREAIHKAAFNSTGIRLFKTPQAWLEADQKGAVVLDFHEDILTLLSGIGRIIVDSVELEARINAALSPKLPEIRVVDHGC